MPPFVEKPRAKYDNLKAEETKTHVFDGLYSIFAFRTDKISGIPIQ